MCLFLLRFACTFKTFKLLLFRATYTPYILCIQSLHLHSCIFY
uniref:Uncharacterized protein n=1 Tax=Anguilla anguilla TaxID=7936 RepID=A0A0E9PA90_ANGAN